MELSAIGEIYYRLSVPFLSLIFFLLLNYWYSHTYTLMNLKPDLSCPLVAGQISQAGNGLETSFLLAIPHSIGRGIEGDCQ